MASFSGIGYSLGNTILSKAFATNLIGSSIVSSVSNSTIAYQTAPTQSPTGINLTSTTTSVSLIWTDLTGFSNIGYSPLTNYIVYWD